MSAPTTLTAFVAALGNLTVTGVTRKYAYPPASLSDLPAQWPQIPSGEEVPITFSGGGGWPTLRAELIVAVEAYEQNTQAANHAATVTMMDNLATALRATANGVLAQSKPAWTIRLVSINVAGIDYWAALASVTAYG